MAKKKVKNEFVKNPETKFAVGAKLALQEPIYTNLFEVEFVCDKLNKRDSELLAEQVSRISFTKPPQADNIFGLTFPGSLFVAFNQNIVKGKAQPIRILEKLRKNVHTINVKITLHDKFGKNFRKTTIHNAVIKNISGLENFDYANPDVSELYVDFEFYKIKSK